jgi:Fe-S cluster biogenesis protein NfuA/nitrite reductase/ring-hydroxylating ferredoxin subunit
MPERATGSTMDRVAQLLREIGVAPTIERARERSEELVRALVAFYGEGLERVLDIVHETAGERSEAIFAALCRDTFVESLLALHGLHPLSLEDRVQAALDSIRPYLESHEGNVELVRVDDGVAYVRLAGSCDGCQSSSATLKHAVEAAIREHVAGIVEVRAEGVDAAPATAPSLKLQSDWIALDALPELATDGLAHVSCAGTSVLLVGCERTFFAYRDRCPVCTRALDGARLEWPFVRCAACGERFDVVHAGRVAENATLCAEPFPLVREDQSVRVAIPLGV